jgi:uncharacterized protein (DUF4415 family)
MGKKKSDSSLRDQRAAKKERVIKDSEIDFSDIPELTDEQLRNARRVGRPRLGPNAKRLISIRIDPELLRSLHEKAEKKGIGYQSLIHQILKKAVGT